MSTMNIFACLTSPIFFLCSDIPPRDFGTDFLSRVGLGDSLGHSFPQEWLLPSNFPVPCPLFGFCLQFGFLRKGTPNSVLHFACLKACLFTLPHEKTTWLVKFRAASIPITDEGFPHCLPSLFALKISGMVLSFHLWVLSFQKSFPSSCLDLRLLFFYLLILHFGNLGSFFNINVHLCTELLFQFCFPISKARKLLCSSFPLFLFFFLGSHTWQWSRYTHGSVLRDH